MKKLLSIFLIIAVFVSLAILMSPAAFADDGTAAPATFVVEKNPTSETVKAGGKAIFMSYPKGETSYTAYWTFEDTEGNVIEAENALSKFCGLVIEYPDIKRIRLKSIPEEMNGLKVQAHFVKADGETIHSDYAFLYVEPNPCAETKQSDDCDCPKQNKNCGTIVISKHPLDETLLRDGQSSTYFTAHASNYSWISWEFKIGDYGEPFSAETAANEYGVCIEGFDSEKLWIHNIGWGINGWYVRAVFHDCNGCPTYSKWAFMRLVEYVEPCKPCHPCNPCPPPPCNNWVCDPYRDSPYVPTCGWSQTTVVTTAHIETDVTSVSVYGGPIGCYP